MSLETTRHRHPNLTFLGNWLCDYPSQAQMFGIGLSEEVMNVGYTFKGLVSQMTDHLAGGTVRALDLRCPESLSHITVFLFLP